MGRDVSASSQRKGTWVLVNGEDNGLLVQALYDILDVEGRRVELVEHARPTYQSYLILQISGLALIFAFENLNALAF